MIGAAYTRDPEVVHRLKPEPMTEAEIAAQSGVEDLDFEIFRHKMEMIAQEGKETTMKLGASNGMRWGDVAFGIYTAQGDLAVVATGIWFHAVLGQIPVKYIIKHWVNNPTVGVKPGDSFFFNDPYICGVHPADMGLVIPVFHEGRLVCFAGAIVHSGECGASEPGGVSTSAQSKYDEGLKIPPMKVGENYQLRDDVLTMFSAMVRDPRTFILDIKARLAASRIAERRILEVIEQKGEEFFVGGLRKILNVTADAARKKLSLLHDGTFRQPRFMDTVGMEEGLTKIAITIRKEGDKLYVSFEDTSPMMPQKPLNTYFQGALGLIMVYLCGWFFYDLPANNGLLEVVEWEVPGNALINAQGDAPTSLAPYSQAAFALGVFLIGARMTYHLDPSRAVAAWMNGFGVAIYGGLNQWGEPCADITPEMNATGCGARPDMDGVDCAGSYFATMSDCSDVETTESDRPFVYLFRNYFNGSYGHGKFRGGAAVGLALMVHNSPFFLMGAHGYGSKFPSTLGIFGGYAVPPTFIQAVHGSNAKQLLAAADPRLPHALDAVYGEGNPEEGARAFHHMTMMIEPFGEGDTFYVPCGGGAGYGDVLERDPQAVIADLKAGLTTEHAAREVYRVAYDPDTLRLDEEGTERLRAEARAERLRRGRPYSEFIKEWNELRPPDHLLKYYGTYPHPSVGIAQMPPMPMMA